MFMDLFLSGKDHKFISQPILHKKNYIINYSTIAKTVKLNNYSKRIFVNNYYDTTPVKVHAYNGS